ncbi:MAG: NAD(P)/FAD-dependent oxidoreductase [Bacteroidia bacterium]
MSNKIVVIGGGAAGFFAAITCASENNQNEVIILEKTSKLLQKVKISGGGRCNVTHACFEIKPLTLAYPRGEKQLKSAFTKFATKETVEWFESRKVKLKTEADGRMFPTTNNSQTIIDCLLKEAKKLKIEIKTETGVSKIIPTFSGGFDLQLTNGDKMYCNKVIVATGGSPKNENLKWLKDLNIKTENPVPSLFSFNITDEKLRELSGISVNPVRTRITHTKLEFSGPILITHWGLSGPVILKASSYGARILAERNYEFEVEISWLDNKKEDAVRQELMNLKAANPNKSVKSLFPFYLPARLNSYLIAKAGIDENLNWAEISKDDVNAMINTLVYDKYNVNGRTAYKEEFVTCGGVNLDEIDFKTMECKRIKGLYFAGEILDIDGITGGFNFQAAWTTGYIAGKAAAL